MRPPMRLEASACRPGRPLNDGSGARSGQFRSRPDDDGAVTPREEWCGDRCRRARADPGGGPRAVGASADGLHAGLPHHPRAARGLVGLHGADRQLPGHQARRRRRAAAGAAVVEVHGGHVRRRRRHRDSAHLRVRAAVAQVHGPVGRGVRHPVRLRGAVLLHRGDLHRHLHLRLAPPEAVGPLLDRRARRAHRHPRQRQRRGRQRVDELAGGLHAQQRRRGGRRRPAGR